MTSILNARAIDWMEKLTFFLFKDTKMHQKRIEELQNYFKSHNKSKEYLAHSSKVHSVGWSCDGRRLASGSFDKSVCIYTLDRDRLVSLYMLS